MTRKTVFPSNLGARDAGDPNESESQRERRLLSNAQLEREVELGNKNDARCERLLNAMRGLPLQEGEESHIPGLLTALESTFYAVKRQLKNTPATKGRVEEQLRKLARLCDKLVDHITDMDRDATAMWAVAGRLASFKDAVVNAGALLEILMKSGGWARRGLEATKRSPKGKRGPDAMAAAMRDAAAFVYMRLTGRRAGRVYDAVAGTEEDSLFTGFLAAVYAAYGIKASPKSRTRKPRMGKIAG